MRRAILPASVLSVVAVFLGCSIDVSGTGGTLQSGRSVTVNTDRLLGSVHCEATSPDTEQVTLRSLTKKHKIVVAPTSIDVDGTVAEIAEATRSVVISDTDGRLQIAADGTQVYDAKF